MRLSATTPNREYALTLSGLPTLKGHFPMKFPVRARRTYQSNFDKFEGKGTIADNHLV